MLYPRLASCLNDRVLDFGCGIGDFLVFRQGTTGVDINPHNVEYCRSLGLAAEVIENGVIPFADHSFDSLIMDNVLEHIPEPEVNAVLNEVLRVLRPGGRLLIGVPGPKGYESDPDHCCFYSEPDLVALFQGVNCRLLELFHMPVNITWLESRISQYCVYALFESPPL
ncbi:Methyltransferase domain-containing protein [Mariprofundus ferrinatatus]|uniref:Methyltransferase domain-containing protein n=2 Tax=Mariprofundus ferrinatatus TaxID=1921087 RepID=A0A2K8L921_9PROT|nr:Methyltransferase domain-containing protein [Mariprofundus ferrinatatus]